MKSISEEHISQIREMMESPEFEVASRWHQDINSFYLNTPLEMDHSRIIGWLLDPRQPHGLRGTALRALYAAAKSSADAATAMETAEIEKSKTPEADERKFKEEQGRRKEFFDALSARKFANRLEHVDVELEVSVEYEKSDKSDKSDKGNCRLDILVSNPVDEWMIVIENKSGSSEGLDQTDRYKEWKEQQFSNRKNYPVLLVFMDLFGKTAKCADGGWVSVDYEWMNDVIREVVTAPATAPRIRMFLSDYLGRYMEDDDDWYAGVNEAAVKLVKKYPEAVEAANNVKKAYSDQAHRLSEYAEEDWLDSQLLAYEIWQNRATISFLSITDAREMHEKSVIEQIPGIEIDLSSKRATYYCRSEWEDQFPDEKGRWPVCIKVEHLSNKGGKHSFSPKLRIRPEELEDGSSDQKVLLQNVVAKAGIKSREGQLRFDIPLIDEALVIESTDEIVLPAVADIKRWLEMTDEKLG